MNLPSSIIKKTLETFFLIILLFLYTPDSFSNDLDDLFDKNLSKLSVSNFKWKSKTKSTQPVFEYIEISNDSSISYNQIILEVQIYDETNVLYKFPIFINDSISKNERKIFNNVVANILLPFTPINTSIGIKTASIEYQNMNNYRPWENITILDLDYSIDSSASKTVSFSKFSYENISKFFYKNVKFLISIFDKNENKISEETLISSNPIAPGEIISIAPLTLGIKMMENANIVSLKIIDAEMISPKTYVASGGLVKEIKIENIYDESVKKISIPSDDLEIIKYSWDSKVRNTIGLIDLKIYNNSNYDYKNIIFEVYFLNERGNAINKRRYKYKEDYIIANKEKIIKVDTGILDFDFSSIEISVISAESKISNVENAKNVKQLPLRVKETQVDESSYVEMEQTEIAESIVILDYDFKENIKYLKLMNLSDEDINKLEIKLKTSSGKEKIIIIRGLKSNSERKFMNIDLGDLLINNDRIISISIQKAFK